MTIGKNQKHWAFCPQTGEVLCSSTGNELKRHLRAYLRAKKHFAQLHMSFAFYGRCQWVFGHGQKGVDRAAAKARAIIERNK